MRSPRVSGAAGALFAVCAAVSASSQSPEVIDLEPGAFSSRPQRLTKHGYRLLFVAQSGSSGLELWETDGTAAGTRPYIEFAKPGSSTPSLILPIDGERSLVVARDPIGLAMFATDGTADGTHVLHRAIIQPTANRAIARVGHLVFYSGFDDAFGRELYKTDGTFEGTGLVSDIVPGVTSSAPRLLTAFRDRLFFAISEPSYGFELWVSDGTEAGTHLFKDIAPPRIASQLAELTVVGDRLFFVADSGAGAELWQTDGTPEGTAQVLDIVPGSVGSSPSRLFAYGDLLLFTADDGVHGRELWKSDGTAAGTAMVADILAGSESSNPTLATAAGGFVYFTATGPGVGTEVFVTDGTAAGTTMVRDVRPGPPSSMAADFVAVGRSVWFTADNGAGRQLWRATPRGAERATNLRLDSGPDSLTFVSGRLVFVGEDSTYGRELWMFDPGATAEVVEPGCSASGVPMHLTATEPVLGDVLRIAGSGARDDRVTVLAFSSRPARPTSLEGTPCTLFLDSPSLLALTVPTVLAGQWTFELQLPNLPGLAGVQGALQAFSGPSSIAGRIEMSNGIVLTFSDR